MTPHPFRDNDESKDSYVDDKHIPPESRTVVKRYRRRPVVQRRFRRMTAIVASIPALWTLVTLVTGHVTHARDFAVLTLLLLLFGGVADWLLF